MLARCAHLCRLGLCPDPVGSETQPTSVAAGGCFRNDNRAVHRIVPWQSRFDERWIRGDRSVLIDYNWHHEERTFPVPADPSMVSVMYLHTVFVRSASLFLRPESRSHGSIITLLSVALLIFAVLFSSERARADVDFQRDIRPILSNHCFRCHGPDDQTREGGLRLDMASDATADRGGYRAIAAGDAAASAIIDRMESDNPYLQMPPPDSGPGLTPEQIRMVRQWIDDGAVYEPHWAFRPIQRPELPRVQPGADADEMPRGHHPIDAFVLDRLQQAGIEPSPQADRSTLIRRLFLDLTGLPPEPEQVRTFLNDREPEAYERIVSMALASPRYGERWGRHWLDQARYADTHGYTIDSERSIWPYRDWVIHALNRDMPFDQFTIEQLAGDLLPDATEDQRIATGFHRNTLVNQEGGTDAEQFRSEAVMDRVNTTGAVWLGLTFACAQCHTHKYDPITLDEYYQMFAFFNNTRDVNSAAPTIQVIDDRTRERLEELDRMIEDARQQLADYDRQQEASTTEQPETERPVEWQALEVEEFRSAAGASWQRLEDGSILVSGLDGDQDQYTVTLASPETGVTAIRLLAMTHPDLPRNGPGRAGNGNFVLNGIQLFGDDSDPVPWLHATADHSQRDYPIEAAIDGDPATGWAINVSSGNMNVDRTATLMLAEPLTVAPDRRLVLRMEFGPRPARYNLGRFRLEATSAPLTRLGLPDPQRARLANELKQWEDQRKQLAAGIPTTLVMQELDRPRPTHMFIRGDFLRPGDAVQPDVPAVLPPLPTGDSRPTRLDLARWLVAPDNPLTARVTINRIWMRYFGRGLVETEDDFGMQGSLPTHPDLLDWLAAEFIESGWSMKHMHRLIVTSATYRQSSHQRPDLDEIDPLNKLLARQTRLRVEAEIVRDLALAASGLLDHRIGGPSVYPPQPAGVYAFTQRSAAWPTSQGPDRYRRAMYTFFMRSAPYPLLSTFDTPDFSTTCTRRESSNTPLQSLAVANDQAMVELTQGLARRLLLSADSDQQRIELAYLICFSRLPTDFERQRVRQYLSQQQEQFSEHPEDAEKLSGSPLPDGLSVEQVAAWTAVARVLINLDEFITRE